MVTVSRHSHGTVTKTEVGVKGWGIVVTDVTTLLVGGMWTFWDFGLGQHLNALPRALWAMLVGTWTAVVLRTK